MRMNTGRALILSPPEVVNSMPDNPRPKALSSSFESNINNNTSQLCKRRYQEIPTCLLSQKSRYETYSDSKSSRLHLPLYCSPRDWLARILPTNSTPPVPSKSFPCLGTTCSQKTTEHNNHPVLFFFQRPSILLSQQNLSNLNLPLQYPKPNTSGTMPFPHLELSMPSQLNAGYILTLVLQKVYRSPKPQTWESKPVSCNSSVLQPGRACTDLDSRRWCIWRNWTSKFLSHFLLG